MQSDPQQCKMMMLGTMRSVQRQAMLGNGGQSGSGEMQVEGPAIHASAQGVKRLAEVVLQSNSDTRVRSSNESPSIKQSLDKVNYATGLMGWPLHVATTGCREGASRGRSVVVSECREFSEEPAMKQIS